MFLLIIYSDSGQIKIECDITEKYLVLYVYMHACFILHTYNFGT